jgi:hypothetical protein
VVKISVKISNEAAARSIRECRMAASRSQHPPPGRSLRRQVLDGRAELTSHMRFSDTGPGCCSGHRHPPVHRIGICRDSRRATQTSSKRLR